MKRDLLLVSNGVRKLMAAVVTLSLLVCCTLFSPAVAYAQAGKGKLVTGKVTDARGPMIGVTVSVKGHATRAALTDLDGNYSIDVSGVTEPALEFTYVGYETQELPVGARSVVDVMLKESTQKIDEVVVTALGITRAEKSLGYAVSKVSGDDIAQTVSGNWLDGMNGKVAGMSFDSASTGPAATVRVTLRGESSLSHDNNEALFVVDGVPLGNEKTASGGTSEDADAPIDYGNGLGDLNPDDIASVSVLKGPAATALYGSRAQNGAVIITTKSGQKQKGIGVNYTFSFVGEQASYWPDLQTEYGSGTSAITTYARINQKDYSPQQYTSFWTVYQGSDKIADRLWSRAAWGMKYGTETLYGVDENGVGLTYMYASLDWEKLKNNRLDVPGSISVGTWEETLGSEKITHYDGASTDYYTLLPYLPQDYYKGFYETGLTFKNSISVSGNNGKGTSVRASFQDTRNNWIVPNTGYNQESASFSVNSKLNKVVTVKAKVNYYRKKSDNLPTTGYNTSSAVYQLLYTHPDVDLKSYWDEYISGRIDQAFEAKDGGNADAVNLNSLINCNGSTDTTNNPYWLTYEHLNTQVRDRVYGNVQVDFALTKDLNLFVRSGIDLFNDNRTQRKPVHTTSFLNGWYRVQDIFRYEVNSDFLLSYKKQFGRFHLGVNFGGNNMVYNHRNQTITAEKLSTPGVYQIHNSVDRPKVSYILTEKMINSLYGMISLNYNDTYFLDFTARNDWSSALAKGNNSYFYPSVSASVLLDQAIPGLSDTNWLDMLKIRGSWANVGNDTSAYQITDYYTNSSYSASYLLPGTLNNPDLKPENTESWEVGLEAHLWKKRLSIDVAYYDSNTTNQILKVPTDQITGADYKMINAGKVNNHGVEVSLGAKIIDKRNWSWDVNFNWSRNWNQLVELAPGVELYQLNTSFTAGNNVFIYAYPGKELGRIYGYGFQRAPEGAYYTDAETGQRVDCSGQIIVTSDGYPQMDNQNLIDLGSIYPDWKGGLNTTLRYKNIRLSMNFTYQYGGNCYSRTHATLASSGKTTDTLYGRYDGLVQEGVQLAADGTYSKNTTITNSIAAYYSDYYYNAKNAETNTYDTSFLKLKQVNLDYTLGKKAIQKIGWLRSLSVGVFATNLFCITDFPQYDPEAATFNAASISRGIETGAYPMTRTYGVTLKLGF